MKVYRVVVDRDGETTKEPGKITTAIERSELYYGAESVSEVWNEIKWIRDDVEQTLIAIIEVIPAITIVKPNAN